MDRPISETLLIQLSTLLTARLGLYFPPERWSGLERGISAAIRDFGFTDVASGVQWLLQVPWTRYQIEVLASYLTVGETYFFREKRLFQYLEEQLLPSLIRARQQTEPVLRIWSAGCCTGEEPYSIAILLSKLLTDLSPWHITILATDVNPHFLQKAAEGIYSTWSFRETPPEIQERYFHKKARGQFAIRPALKKLVQFSYHNLVEEGLPAPLNKPQTMDVIFCRNVLMYFEPNMVRRVIKRLYQALTEEGWLIVSPSEAALLSSSPFVAKRCGDILLYQKLSCSPVPSLVASPRTEWPFSDPTTKTSSLTDAPESKRWSPLPDGFSSQTFEMTRSSDSIKPNSKMPDLATTQPTNSPTEECRGEEMARLARDYANQGKLEEALVWCERAIATEKLNPSLHYLRAMIVQEQGDRIEAVRGLKRALYLDPDFVLAHFALGYLLQPEETSLAQKYLRNALVLLTKYPPEALLPEGEGLTAGRLTEIITSILYTPLSGGLR